MYKSPEIWTSPEKETNKVVEIKISTAKEHLLMELSLKVKGPIEQQVEYDIDDVKHFTVSIF
jgi:hypothetical protein